MPDELRVISPVRGARMSSRCAYCIRLSHNDNVLGCLALSFVLLCRGLTGDPAQCQHPKSDLWPAIAPPPLGRCTARQSAPAGSGHAAWVHESSPKKGAGAGPLDVQVW